MTFPHRSDIDHSVLYLRDMLDVIISFSNCWTLTLRNPHINSATNRKINFTQNKQLEKKQKTGPTFVPVRPLKRRITL